MTSNTLYRKYRPQSFADVIGQPAVIKILTSSLAHHRLGQAYLFTGPRGTGKTTTARLLAKAATCTARGSFAEACGSCPHCLSVTNGTSLDIIEIDAASNTSVDNIRDLKDSIKLLPTLGTSKVYIIDEVHMLSINAFNALLKTLEEPPKHVLFILATTSLHKVPETILSRCQRFDFSRFPLHHLLQKLTLIAEQEGVTIEPAALEMIALAADGGMRDAESLLMQIISIKDKDITADDVSVLLNITDQQKINRFIECLLTNDAPAGIILIHQLTEKGDDLFLFTNALINTLRTILLITLNANILDQLTLEITETNRQKLAVFAEHFSSETILRYIELFQEARNTIRSASLPQLPLEIALIKAVPCESTSTPTPSMSIVRETPAQTTYIPAQSITLATVLTQWTNILKAVQQVNSSLAYSVQNCIPVSYENNTIVLQTKFPLYQEKLAVIENKLTVEQAFDTILKSKTLLKVIKEEPSLASLDDALSILGGRIIQE
jgi:DNA polymerase-3 subunit gamma/tau